MSTANSSGGMGAWLVRLLSRLLFLLIIFIAGALTMHFGMHSNDHADMQQLQDTVTSQQSQISTLQAELASAQSKAQIEQGTADSLQQQLSGLQQELSSVRDQLSFYEQLLPPGPAGSVSIRAFTAEQEGAVLSYRVLLTRNTQAAADAFNGKMQFIATGTLDGEELKINISSEALQAEDTQDQFKLQFDRFQRSTGVIPLQPGFKIKSVQLDIFEGDALRASSETAVGVK